MANSTGYGSTGYRSTGNRSTGYGSTGYRSTGNRSTGDRSTGNRSTGNYSTGYRSTGNYSTGYRSTGNRSTGYGSTGYRSTGHCSTGHRSTGSWSISDYSTGHFCTVDYMGFSAFNKPITLPEWKNAEKPTFLFFDLTIWIPTEEMTEQEKQEHPTHKTTGGYLKVLDYKEAFQTSYDKASEKEKEQLLALPNFDAEVFKEISGIDITQDNKDKELAAKKQALIEKANELLKQAEEL
jgi:hypothetical protein